LKTRILIVEDDPQRIFLFRRHLETPENDLAITSSAQLAIDMLSDYRYDWLFLDHDLNPGDDMEFMGAAVDNINSGYAVACFLEERKEFCPQHVVLHSMNPWGVQRMNAAIPQAKEVTAAWTVSFDQLKAYMGA